MSQPITETPSEVVAKPKVAKPKVAESTQNLTREQICVRMAEILYDLGLLENPAPKKGGAILRAVPVTKKQVMLSEPVQTALDEEKITPEQLRKHGLLSSHGDSQRINVDAVLKGAAQEKPIVWAR